MVLTSVSRVTPGMVPLVLAGMPLVLVGKKAAANNFAGTLLTLATVTR